jgi:RES domain-containing protein
MLAYRLSSGRFPAISGDGAAIAGGRWNPIGAKFIDYVLTRIEIADTAHLESSR